MSRKLIELKAPEFGGKYRNADTLIGHKESLKEKYIQTDDPL